MTPEEILNAVMDEVETRVATALCLSADQIYETRETGEQSGSAAYVSGQILEMAPATQCADRALLEVTIGFELCDDGERPKRVQRLAAQLAVRRELLWNARVGREIPHAKIPTVTDMPVSEMGDPKPDTFMGGLTWRCQVDLPRD